MRLTRYTDYSLRVLMFVAARDGEVSTIAQIAGAYGISRDHLMKVAQELGQAGYLRTVRGRSGGLLLARPAAEIRIGDVVRRMEGDCELADCGTCVIAPVCVLAGTLDRALAAFMAVLDATTLADIATPRSDLIRTLSFGTAQDSAL
jgi:Rrf2 family nitric oxide-sensitive transcriptional repressor